MRQKSSRPLKKARFLFPKKLALILITCMVPNLSWAVTKDWLGGTNNWFDPNNWSPTGIPAPADDVTINTTPFAQIINNQSTTINSLIAGQLALSTGRLDINSAGKINIVSNTTPSAILGLVASSAGELNVSDANSLFNIATGGLTIGFQGSGILNISNSGQVIDNSAVIADSASSTGVVNVSDTGSKWVTNTFLLVGDNGTGGLNVFNGGSTSVGSLTLGNAAGNGVVTVDAGLLEVSSILTVAQGGSGLLLVQNAGHVANNVQANIGFGAGSTGVATVTGAGSLWETSDLFVGFNGMGSMFVLNGGTVASNQGTVGGFAGSTGIATVSDPGSQWVLSSVLFVGNNGAGTLNILNGGTVSTALGTGVGFAAAGPGVIVVDGIGSSLNTASLRIGAQVNGELTVQNNGAVRVTIETVLGNSAALLQLLSGGILETLGLVGSSTNITTNFDGGILRAKAENKAFIQGFTPGQLTLNNNGLIIDSNGYRIATSDVFSGTGGLTKAGAGILTIRGNQAYTGLTSVAQGVLDVKGVLVSPVQVLTSGTLQGTGTVGQTTVQGVVAPGNPTNEGNTIGNLSVNGDFTQLPGSFYQTEINSLGQADLLSISNTAFINGGTVDVVVTPGVYTSGTTFTILTALNGVSGTYNNVIESLPFLDVALSYDPENVYLSIVRNSTPFATAALTINEFNTAVAVDSLGIGNPVFDAISSLPSISLAPQAFDSLSGEIHASTLGAFMEESRYVRYATLNRLQQSSIDNDLSLANHQLTTTSGITFWGQGFGSWGDMDGNGNAASLDRHINGFFIGADTLLMPESRLGFVFGVSDSEFNVHARSSSVSSDNYYAGIYAGTHLYSLNMRAGAAYTWHDIDTRRSINFLNYSDYVKSYNHGQTKQAYGELGYPIPVPFAHIEPFVGGAYVNVDAPFFEWGGPAGLNGDGQEDLFYSTVGLRESASLITGGRLHIAERLMLGWQHANHHLNPQSTMNFNGGSSDFIIYGAPIAKNSLLVDAGLVFKKPNDERLRFTLAYIGQWASQVSDHGLSGTITYRID